MVGVAGYCAPARAGLALVASPPHAIYLSSLSPPPTAQTPLSVLLPRLEQSLHLFLTRLGDAGAARRHYLSTVVPGPGSPSSKPPLALSAWLRIFTVSVPPEAGQGVGTVKSVRAPCGKRDCHDSARSFSQASISVCRFSC
jgi:hypothetical protein